MDVKDIKQKYETLEQNRSLWHDTWDDVFEYCLWNRPTVTGEQTKGEIRNDDIYDSTANKSLQDLAAALNSMLTNQSSEWLQLVTDDEELNKVQEIKEWLDILNTEVREALENSNFYSEVHTFYIDLAAIGTAVMFIDKSIDSDQDIYFSTRHIKEIYLSENAEGQVDTVYRKFEMTARQVEQKFGFENLTKNLARKYENTPEEEVTILHCVMPRKEYDSTKKDSKNMPFASIWMDFEDNEIILESGFEVFPYIVARWSKSSGEVYGRSPAISAMPDIKMVNKMMETLIKTSERTAVPPVNVPDEIIDIDLTPGGINYYDATMQGKIEPIFLGQQLPLTFDMITNTQEKIKDQFFTNELHLAENNRMTTEEVRIRTDENMRVLSPVFGRLIQEFMETLVARVLNILKYSLNPDGSFRIPLQADSIPEEVSNRKLRLRFMSPLAKAQKYSDYRSISNTIQIGLSWSQIKPEILDNLNLDEAIRHIGDLDGVPRRILNDPKIVEKIRQARAQQQQLQQQMQIAQASADTAKTATQAEKNIAQAEKE